MVNPQQQQRQKTVLTSDDLQGIIDDDEQPGESAEEVEAAEQAGFDEEMGITPSELKKASSEVDALEPDDLDDDAGKKAAAKKAEADEPVPGSRDQDTDQGLTGVLTTLEGINTRLRNIEGKQGFYNDEIQKIQKSAADAADKGGGDSPTAEQIAEANEDPELRTQLEEDYPDWFKWADNHEKAINARVDTKLKKLDLLDEKVSKSDVHTLVKDAIREVNAERDLMTEYPEWEKTTATNEFGDWFRAQDESVQALGASQNPADVHTVMTGYSAFVKAAKKAEPDDDEPPAPDDEEETGDKGKTPLTADQKAKKRLAEAIAPTKSKGKGLPTKNRGAQTEDEGFESVFEDDKG